MCHRNNVITMVLTKIVTTHARALFSHSVARSRNNNPAPICQTPTAK